MPEPSPVSLKDPCRYWIIPTMQGRIFAAVCSVVREAAFFGGLLERLSELAAELEEVTAALLPFKGATFALKLLNIIMEISTMNSTTAMAARMRFKPRLPSFPPCNVFFSLSKIILNHPQKSYISMNCMRMKNDK
jgi:hypothetical protein